MAILSANVLESMFVVALRSVGLVDVSRGPVQDRPTGLAPAEQRSGIVVSVICSSLAQAACSANSMLAALGKSCVLFKAFTLFSETFNHCSNKIRVRTLEPC